jgi:hypothetical protein
MDEDEYVPNYDVKPGEVAIIDGLMVDVASDLDTMVRSFRHHAARVDDTIAFTVLSDNIITLVEKGQLSIDAMCMSLAMAVQRLAKEPTDG